MKAGWRRESLDRVCTRITDGSHYSPKSQESGIPYITVRDLDDKCGRIDFEGCKFVGEDDFRDLERNGCSPSLGDVLFSKDGTVGKVALVREDRRFVVLSSLAILTPNREMVLPEYLEHVLRSSEFLSEAIGKKTGVAIKRIVLKNLKQILIPLPPLKEQESIVAVLDEAFDGLARARANATTNLLNARELFESALERQFSLAIDEYQLRRVSEICESIVDCVNRTAPRVASPTPFKMIRTTNIRNGKLDLKTVGYVDEATFTTWTRRQLPQIGDVLLTREAPLGEAAIIETDDKVFLGQRIVSYRADPEASLPRFLYFALRSKPLKRQYEKFGAGATVQHMRVPQSKELLIPVPPIEDQKIIIQILDDVENRIHELEEAYRAELQDINDLRQSLLQKAFAGEIT